MEYTGLKTMPKWAEVCSFPATHSHACLDPVYSEKMQERLQKLIARAGVASRRAAEELILAGEVSVNGRVVKELGSKADPEKDHIKVRGRLINPKLRNGEKVYFLLNKPKGYLSSVADPENRPLVTDLIKGSGRLHPVGRLDFNSEGLLFLTNDGEFTNLVASSKNIPKVYQVKVKGEPNEAAINKLRRGVRLEDGFRTAPAEIKQIPSRSTNAWFEVVLFEGHNQQIRRMFDSIGHSVVKLRRVAIGQVRDDELPVGKYRKLTSVEVAGLFGKPSRSVLGPRKFNSPNTKKRSPAGPAARLKRTGEK